MNPKSLVAQSAVAGLAVVVCWFSGCDTQPFDARFETSSDPDVFGTLIDDRGNFEFRRNPDTGNLQEVLADAGDITLPTDGQDLSFDRPDGSNLTLSPEGENDVLVAVRNDPDVGNADLQVDRAVFGDLGAVIRPNARAILQDGALCEENQSFLDGACEIINAGNLDALAQGVSDDLTDRGVDPPPVSTIRAILERYLIIAIDCCMAWDEFRSNGGDACTT